MERRSARENAVARLRDLALALLGPNQHEHARYSEVIHDLLQGKLNHSSHQCRPNPGTQPLSPCKSCANPAPIPLQSRPNPSMFFLGSLTRNVNFHLLYSMLLLSNPVANPIPIPPQSHHVFVGKPCTKRKFPYFAKKPNPIQSR